MDQSRVNQATRIVIVDDHPVVRGALRSVLERRTDLEVVDEAGDLAGAHRALATHRPRVLLLDVNLPDGSAFAALPSLRRTSPASAIVLLTADRRLIPRREEAEAAGIHGALAKNAERHQLITAVREAAAGRRYFPAAGRSTATADDDRALLPLSFRETEVLRLLALGHSGREIAERLGLSHRTIETHREHIQQKIGLTSRADLTRYALRNRLVLPAR